MNKYFCYEIGSGMFETTTLPHDDKIIVFSDAAARQQWLDNQLLIAKIYKFDWRNLHPEVLQSVADIIFYI